MDGSRVGASIRLAPYRNAFSAGAARRTGHGARAFRGRRNCADAAEARCRGRGRYSDSDHAPAYADECAGLRRTQRRWRSGGETRHADAPHANRVGERPRKPSNLRGNGWSARRPHPKAISRLSRVRAQAPTAIPAQGARLGRSPPQIRGRLGDWRLRISRQCFRNGS